MPTNKKVKKHDLYDAIFPLYVLSKVLNLGPIHLRERENKKYFVSSVGLNNFIHLLIILCPMFYGTYLIEHIEFTNGLRGAASRFELYMGIILTTVIIITLCINNKLIIASVNDILDVDKMLRLLQLPVLYSNARRFCIYQIIFITTVFMSKFIINMFGESQTQIMLYSIFNIVDYINTISLFQYVNLVLLLWQRYKWINQQMKLLRKQMIMRETHNTFVIYSNEFLKNKKHDSTFLNQSNDTKNIKMIKDDLENFLYIMKIHNKLYIIGIHINRAYSLQLLLTITMRFIMLITQLLHIYKLLLDKNYSDGNNTASSNALIMIFLFLHFSKIFMVSAVSSITVNEVR